jgi:hypothetical protein
MGHKGAPAQPGPQLSTNQSYLRGHAPPVDGVVAVAVLSGIEPARIHGCILESDLVAQAVEQLYTQTGKRAHNSRRAYGQVWAWMASKQAMVERTLK